MNYQKTTLDNGIRVVSENHAESRCVVTGLWVEVGTRFEKFEQMGISHLLEHMVFKGTEKYTALELARSLEARGGDINAFTAREHTCFHTTSLKEDLPLCIDVLAQLTAFARFEKNDFEKEKRVIQQEIQMAMDELEEYFYDLYHERLYPKNSLGYQILGTVGSVDTLKVEDVKSYCDAHFIPENIIIAAAGAVNHEELVDYVQKSFKNKKWSESKKGLQKFVTPSHSQVREFYQKDCEQYHVLVGLPACSYSSEDRFNGYVLNTALGGGMTSRLYQAIREDRGLVYSIFSMLNTFTDTGFQTIYAGTEKKNVNEVVDLIHKELVNVRANGLPSEDIEFFKTQARGQIIIGSEDIDNRMNSLAVNEMVFRKYRSIDSVIEDINKVTVDSVMKYINDKLDIDKLNYFLMGPEEIQGSIVVPTP